ncbi:MAG: ABC transporter substrate-binding protein, partial [Trebonia sp.]
MRSARAALAILAAAVLALSACGGSSKPSNSTSSGGKLANGKTFTMAISTDPGNLDPQMTVLSVTRGVGRFLYGRLIQLESSGKVSGSLAQKWQATTTKASFTLRPGITCADGSALTAKDVAANIDFVGNPKNKSPLLGIQVMPGTKATGDNTTRTVTVTSGAPDAFLLSNLGTLPLVCAKGLADRASLAKGKNGAGMYTMTEDVPNDHYTLTLR